MKKSLLFLIFAMLCFGTLASAGTITYNIPEFNGDTYYDPGPFPAYTVADLSIPAGAYTDVSFSGTFGNSTVPNSAGVDLFFGNITDGFYLLAQCFEFDTCWTSGTPTPWSADLGPLDLTGGDYYFDASQTSEYAIRLGATTGTFATPEPLSLVLFGTFILGAMGTVRRKFLI